MSAEEDTSRHYIGKQVNPEMEPPVVARTRPPMHEKEKGFTLRFSHQL